jgi:hypothetical protein
MTAAVVATGIGDLITGLLLGLMLGLIVSPFLRSWMAWQEYVRARRDAGGADRVVHHLEAELEARRRESVGTGRPG